MLQELRMIAPAYSIVPTTAATSTSSLASLMMNTGVVEYNDGVRFDVTAQGLLSFMASSPSAYGYTPYQDGGFRIVKDVANLDHYAVIAALAALMDYGSADEGLSIAQRLTAMRTRPVALRCGPTIETARNILSTLGVTTRQVHFLTGETPDGLDEGHIALEVSIGGGWCFFDVAGDGYFKDSSNHHASVADMIEAGVANCERVSLASTHVNASGLLRVLWAQRYSTEALYLYWCRRIFQIPGILDESDGLIYWYMPAGTESRQSWLLGLQSNYRVLTKAAWLARFYPSAR